MSKEKRRVPKLRFPGFTEDWEQRKLGEVVTINPKTELPDEFKYVDLESVVGTNLLGFQVIKKENAPSRAQRLASYGDVFYQTVRPYQRNNYLFENVDKDMVFSTGYAQLRSKLDSYFLLTLVQNDNFVKVVLDNCTGTSYPAINGSELGKITVQIPSNEVEANQIGKVFRGIDKSITLHQRKLDNLKLKKKALLQKLFPKNGERYPELRFPGFTDAWEQCKLGSIGSTYTGLSGKTKEDFGHGEAQYITYLNVFQNTVSDITMTDKVEIDTTQNEVKYGDVLFTTSSETPEEVGMSSVWLGHTPNIYLNSFCFGFRPNQKIDPYFLGYSLRAPYMRDKIKILAQGISRYNISKNKVMELEISLPNNEEQSLLGIFLRNIDLGITLHQRKLDHLQLQKKALLQQMFV